MARRNKEEKIKVTKESIQKAKGIFTYLRPYRFQFLIGWIFLALSTSAGLVFPFLMGQLLGSGSAKPKNLEESVRLIDLNNVNTIAILLFILFGVQSLFSYFRVVIFTNVTENALRDMRKSAFNKLIYMPMDFFNQNKVGELTSRLSADIVQIQDTLKTTISEFFRQIIMIVGGITFLFFLSWKLALIMLGTVPVMAIIAVFFGRFIRNLSKKAQDQAASSNSIIEEALTGITNVKSFTNEGFVLTKYMKAIEEIRTLNIKSGVWRGLFISFIIFCLFGAIVFIVWQGLLMTQGPHPELSSQSFYSFIMFTIMMGASIGSLPDLYASIQKSIGATENLMNIINSPSEKETLKGSEQPEINGEISFEHVEFSYPQRSDISVLKDISFKANVNDTIALVGTSGSGKSTISSLLLNYYTITNGSIQFNGTPIEKIDTHYLRSKMAIVPQEVILFGGSIRENIAFGNPAADEGAIIEAAKQANAGSSFPVSRRT